MATPPLKLQQPQSTQRRDAIVLIILALLGVGLALIDRGLELRTVLLECVHSLVVTVLFIACLISQHRHPEIRQLGWSKILLGTMLIMIATWADILDAFGDITILGIPFGHTWQQAYIEKFLGYTLGFGLVTFGCFQWVPWMIKTRDQVQRLNGKLTHLLTTLDDRVDSERLSISRELHDDIAQRLTFLGYTAQTIQHTLDKSPDEAKNQLKEMNKEISITLKGIRRISHNLRPEALYALGFIEAIKQFLNKQQKQMPDIAFTLDYQPLDNQLCETAQQPLNISALVDSTHNIDQRYNETQRLHLFRILQESIRNAMKHSQSNTILVQIIETEAADQFIVKDDGKGLPWETLPAAEVLIQQGHLGIAGLRERVSELGGTLQLNTLQSATSNATRPGTQLTITIQNTPAAALDTLQRNAIS